MTGRELKTGVYAALALAAGLALRLWFVARVARVGGDTLVYGNIARNWMQHGVYSLSASPSVPVPTLIRLPGYPLFLMACFSLFGVEHYTAVMYVQCVIDLCTCLLIAALFAEDRSAGGARRTLRCASAGALDGAELANLSCLPTARAALRDRSWRTYPARLPALVSHLGHRFRLDRRGLLELRQRPHLDRRPACARVRLR